MGATAQHVPLRGILVFLVSSQQALACPGVLYDFVNDPVRMGAECEFENFGFTDVWKGFRPQNRGSSLIVQYLFGKFPGCSNDLQFLVANCETGEAAVLNYFESGFGYAIASIADDSVWQAEVLSLPQGHLYELPDGESMQQILAAAASNGMFSHSVDEFNLLEGGGERIDPFCGCKRLYPHSKMAGG